MLPSRRMILAHFWLAFGGFGAALLLGEWQMFIRSPLHAWIGDPELYYRSVTAHGTTMAYVLPTLVAMGFGYFVTEASLQPSAGWAALGMGGLCPCRHRHGHGDRPGRDGSSLGALHLLPADDRQCLLLHRRRTRRRRLLDLGRADVGESVPSGSDRTLARRCRSRCSQRSPDPICGAGPRSAPRSNCCSRSSPCAVGLTNTIDAGLARVFFSWTLHAIVYFWLMPAYIAYYTIVPRAIGGRLFSDQMGRISFILFLVVAMPIGVHHLFEDPEVGSGFKFLHSVFTATGYAADAADRVHHLRFGRDRRAAARRQGRAGMARRYCPGATRSCSARHFPSSCSASAAPAASST